MRKQASSYAPRTTQDITRDRERRIRLAEGRMARETRAMERLDDATLECCTLYQREKARAARQGKPTLKTYEEWRRGVLPEETPTT